MNSSPGFVTVILLILGRTHGDSVTPTGGQMTISEDEFLTINGTYSITSPACPALCWYVRYPGESLQLLLKVLTAGKINGDSVTQTEGLVTVTEGSPVMLSCAYQTTYSAPTVFWYVQDLNKAPQLLLKSLTDNKRTEHQGFHATLHKSNSSFHLQKSSVQLSDSALYYCALSDTVTEMQGKLHTNQGAGGLRGVAL
ncbi:T-cell receptor alpha chain V region CTL-F3 [Cricetulus griseus]|nr:T-cell receptor alpha chain V region CTL-F3 [Cricetulus griseus]